MLGDESDPVAASAKPRHIVVVGASVDRSRVVGRLEPGSGAPAPTVAAAIRNLEEDTRRHRAEQRRMRLVERFRPLPEGVTIERLEEIAECESGGDPKIISSSGLYHGKYQFHPDTWRSVGGKGLPSEAPEVEQDYRAGLLLARSGPGQWPVCGA